MDTRTEPVSNGCQKYSNIAFDLSALSSAVRLRIPDKLSCKTGRIAEKTCRKTMSYFAIIENKTEKKKNRKREKKTTK